MSTEVLATNHVPVEMTLQALPMPGDGAAMPIMDAFPSIELPDTIPAPITEAPAAEFRSFQSLKTGNIYAYAPKTEQTNYFAAAEKAGDIELEFSEFTIKALQSAHQARMQYETMAASRREDEEKKGKKGFALAA